MYNQQASQFFTTSADYTKKSTIKIMKKQGTSLDNSIIINSDKNVNLAGFYEIWKYRELLFFLVWRDIKARYAQSIFGVGWAVIQPVFSMIIFTIIFGNFAKLDSDGQPYAIFSYTALVPWTYFANTLTGASGSLISSTRMLNKVYIPRLIIPLVPVFQKLIDFGISLLLLFALMFWFQIPITLSIIYLPVLILIMIIISSGLGILFTSLAIKFRDIKYGLGIITNLLKYTVPVVYSISIIPKEYHLIYALNPMVGVIEGYRAILLNTKPIPWDLIGVGAIGAIVIFFIGVFFFLKVEHTFPDVS